MTSDNCAVCGERTRYDGHEIAHFCAGGAPVCKESLLTEDRAQQPERDHGLVSISEMNRRIAEAVAAERRACAEIADSLLNTGSTIGPLHGAGIHLAAESIGQRIRERAK